MRDPLTDLLGFDPLLSEEQWLAYCRDGYLKLGHVLDAAELSGLQQRIDEIMLGQAAVPYDRMLFQIDSESGNYGDAGPQTKGHKGARLDYRKIEQLEEDSLFLAYMRQPLFREICARTYGVHVPIACFRAMFMNKPARRGTLLPWHQDRWLNLDRDPLVTLWTALDPVSKANGCVQVIPGSHRFGIINTKHFSGFLAPEHVEHFCPEDRVVHLELEAGEVVLLHNWLLHRSDRNATDIPRRAFSVCYLDARTVSKSPEEFPRIFEAGPTQTVGV